MSTVDTPRQERTDGAGQPDSLLVLDDVGEDELREALRATGVGR